VSENFNARRRGGAWRLGIFRLPPTASGRPPEKHHRGASRPRHEMSKRQDGKMSGADGPTVLSLDEAQVHVAQEVYEYLAESFKGLYNDDAAEARKHMDRILQAMKTAPSTTTCRVNHILSTRSKVQEGLEEEVRAWKTRHESKDSPEEDAVVVWQHPLLDDVVCVGAKNLAASNSKSLASCRVPPVTLASSNTKAWSISKSWPTRAERGWPMTHRVVVCDRFCGEAVLRGSDIFVRGVICADAGIEANEKVAVRHSC